MSTVTLSRTTLLVALCIVVAAAVGMLTAHFLLNPGGAVPDDITLLEPPRPLPEIALVDDTAKPFGLDNLRGGWSLLFFGFTHCPDICPNTLGILNTVHSALKQDGDIPPLKIIFVSVDPRRDTPAALHEYVRYFDKDFVGVTGEIEEIKKLTQALYLPFATTDNPDGGYTVEHSAALVLVNPKAQARVYFTPPHEPQKLAQQLAAVINSE